eukprot:gnl/TRDRNA2_/TRDRNA2_158359_c3_seq1.p1 gnl/TRDRNA2_/TRDRNA2_158359_c3~~gnl/TRDRNA2_/TRDRNA2_158359_c3_seq1.p1  ORF type:complete len:124 (-),score=3.43 gnl/TRDRNA2_/TRDRNA2_158359_c3_seq1:85-456(-)
MPSGLCSRDSESFWASMALYPAQGDSISSCLLALLNATVARHWIYVRRALWHRECCAHRVRLIWSPAQKPQDHVEADMVKRVIGYQMSKSSSLGQFSAPILIKFCLPCCKTHRKRTLSRQCVE